VSGTGGKYMDKAALLLSSYRGGFEGGAVALVGGNDALTDDMGTR
jgi:hypothetical protein